MPKSKDKETLRFEMKRIRDEIIAKADADGGHLTRDALAREALARLPNLFERLASAGKLALAREVADDLLHEAYADSVAALLAEHEERRAASIEAGEEVDDEDKDRIVEMLDLPGVPGTIVERLPLLITNEFGDEIIWIPLRTSNPDQLDNHIKICERGMEADQRALAAKKFIQQRVEPTTDRKTSVFDQIRAKADDDADAAE